jgi:PAS domain S-box-containing protein
MTPNPTQPRILIVEDEAVVARDIAQQLTDLGYEIVGHATNAEQAIALAGELRPSLVLMDIKLAGEMDGIAAALAIRERFALPVIFLTAFAENETLAQAKLSEPCGYVIKPFTERELHTVVQMALHKHQVETKLRHSEERLRLVLLGSTDAVWDHDLVSDELFRSARWSEMLGYSADELPPVPGLWLQLMHPHDVVRTTRNFEAACAGDARHIEIEVRLRHKAGHYVPVLSRSVIVRDAHGRAIRVAGTNTDLTERKQAEAARLAAAVRLQKIAGRVPGLLYQFRLRPDGTSCFPYASDGIREIYRVSPEDVRTDAAKVFAVLHPDDLASVTASILQSARDLTPWQHEYRAKYDDGTVRWLLGSSLPEREADGSVLWHGFITDVTERRATESSLRLRSAALEASANAIIITDRSGLIEWANPAFAALCQWPMAETIGKNPRDLVKSGEHDAAFYRQMWDTLLAGRVWRGEIVNRRKDGALRTEDMTITPVRDERGAISHFIAIKQDITDHKTMEAHFLHAQRMDAVGALAGGVAHDLNNILSPIMMVTGVLRDKHADPEDRELLAMAQSSAQRGAEIVKQLLTFSRGQAGERTLVQPRHLLGEMIAMMRETFPRSLDLKQLLPGTLWTVLADPTQLHQVLLNLCVNARDAMPDGGRLTVSAANVTLAEGDPKLPLGATAGPYVVISIADSGHGIPTEIQHRIFDPFFTTKPVGKGTGLGLSTVLGIMKGHGGFIDLESALGSGSTFLVYFPAIPDGVAASSPPPAPRPAPVSTGETILVVDDERNVRDSIRIILESEHYTVITATDGEAGLAQYLKHRTRLSLVITDLMMPKMDGLTLIRTLRAITPLVKVVVTSGLTELTERRELADLGVPDILMKPYAGPALLALVRTRLAAP